MNEIPNKETLRCLYQFYSETNRIVLDLITEVKASKDENGYLITIVTHRPGIMIGKGGRDIDELIEYLNRRFFDLPVKVELRESQLWSNLWKDDE